jgi:hypothetical protein
MSKSKYTIWHLNGTSGKIGVASLASLSYLTHADLIKLPITKISHTKEISHLH